MGIVIYKFLGEKMEHILTDVPIYEIIKIVSHTNENVKIQHARLNAINSQFHDIIPLTQFFLIYKKIPNKNLYYSQGFIVEVTEDSVYYIRSINGIPIRSPLRLSKESFKKVCSSTSYMKKTFKNFPSPYDKRSKIKISAGKKYFLKVTAVRSNNVILISNDGTNQKSFTIDQTLALKIHAKLKKPFTDVLIHLEGEDSKGNLHFHSPIFQSANGDMVFPKHDISSFFHLP